jgi:hypothetical protein
VKKYNREIFKKRHNRLLSLKEFMKYYLYPEGVAYIPREFPRQIQEAIQIINQSQGVAILAHPRHQVPFLHEVLD